MIPILFQPRGGDTTPGGAATRHIVNADVLAATEGVMACFEIVDSRITDWKIKIQDTVADNASCGVLVLGGRHKSPADIDLALAGTLPATVTGGDYASVADRVGWVITGCESGPKRRPTDPAWLRSLRDQCAIAGVPFFLKQMEIGGSVIAEPEIDGRQHVDFPD